MSVGRSPMEPIAGQGARTLGRLGRIPGAARTVAGLISKDSFARAGAAQASTICRSSATQKCQQLLNFLLHDVSGQWLAQGTRPT